MHNKKIGTDFFNSSPICPHNFSFHTLSLYFLFDMSYNSSHLRTNSVNFSSTSEETETFLSVWTSPFNCTWEKFCWTVTWHIVWIGTPYEVELGLRVILAFPFLAFVESPRALIPSFLPINSVWLKTQNYTPSFPSADAVSPVILYVNRFVREVL